MQEKTLRVLEFNKILEYLKECAVLEDTKKRCLELLPKTDEEEVRKGLAETSEAHSLLLKKNYPPIRPINNIKTSAERAKSGGILSMRELINIAHLLKISRDNISYFDYKEEEYPILSKAFFSIESVKPLEDKIMSAIINEEEIADDASLELMSLRRKIKLLNNKARDEISNMIRSTQYSKYLQDAIVTIRDDRFVVPVKSEYRAEVPGVIHDSSSSGATLFIEPMSVVNINNQIRNLIAEEKEEIERILLELSNEVGSFSDVIIENYNALSCIDFAFAKAKLSRMWNMTEPIVNTDGIINLKNSRHPLIDQKKVVPVNIYLGEKFDTLVITGPNTGGKTVTLKTLGLFTLMAQSGLHIPAESNSTVSIFEDVFADIGDEQSIEQSLSTFSSHMVNIIDILEKANSHSLVLFDELGAGTDPTEGAALAISIIETARSVGAKIASTTHYSEIKLYALSTEGVENGACEFDVSTLRPTFKLSIGVPGKSNAFAISKRLGLKDSIIERAKVLISEDERQFEDVVALLEKNQKRAEKEAKRARSMLIESEKQKKELKKEIKKTETDRDKIIKDAKKEAKEIYENAKKEADQLLKEMLQMKESASRSEMEKKRRKISEKLSKLETDTQEDVFSSDEPIKVSEVKIGDTVLLTTMNSEGIVMSLPDKNGNVHLEVGSIKLSANISTLQKVKHKEQKKKRTIDFSSVRIDSQKNLKSEIDLRGQNLDEALINTDKYLDDAVMAHLETVSIIHGKGTGVLRSGIHDFLKRHKHVKSYRLGTFGEGESGVTIVELK